MPSQHKTSANIGRKAQTGQPGKSTLTCTFVKSSSQTDVLPTAAFDDGHDRSHDASSTTYNTELNKAYADRDRYKSLFEKANKKLSETHQSKDDLKTQVQDLRDENAALHKNLEEHQQANAHLLRQNEVLDQKCTTLEARYDSLASLYGNDSNGASATTIPPSASTPVPVAELPRSSRKSGKKENKDHTEDRGRKKDKEPRGQKAEKLRYSTHFDTKTGPSSSKARRHSFIQGWGPGPGPSQSHAATARASRTPMPAMSPAYNVAYSAVPRTAVPLSPRMYKAKRASAATIYGVENGDYYPYPVAR